jgi:hypothetical protein
MRLRQEIERLDAATRKYLDESRAAADILMKIGAAQHALDAQRERAAYQKSLRIVDPTGRGAESEWNTAKLDADLADLLKRVRVAVQTAPDAPPGFADAVSGAVAGAGFLIATGEKRITPCRESGADDLACEGWYWQRGAMEVTLREIAADRVRGSRRWTSRLQPRIMPCPDSGRWIRLRRSEKSRARRSSVSPGCKRLTQFTQERVQ